MLLIIARHGNTFEKGETPRRVGARTDLPLTETGCMQARALGRWLKAKALQPGLVYSSQLQRTEKTARLAMEEAGYAPQVIPLAIFNEIDYGPDENLPEDAVITRLGEQALRDWDDKALVPPGWNFNPDQCIADWQDFAAQIVDSQTGCVLVVTSNGTARFAPHITGDFDSFRKTYPLKLSTGCAGVFEYENGRWIARGWNLKPDLN